MALSRVHTSAKASQSPLIHLKAVVSDVVCCKQSPLYIVTLARLLSLFRGSSVCLFLFQAFFISWPVW